MLALCMALIFVACDNGNENNDNGGGQTQKETVAMEHNYQEVEQNLETMGKSTGYMITYAITSSATGEADESYTLSFGMKGDIYYVKDEDGDESYYDLSGETAAVIYTKDAGESVWSKETVSYEYVGKDFYKSTMDTEFMSFATMYSLFANSEATKTTATFCGRTCDKYTVNYSYLAVAGFTFTYEVYIDAETSACLKLYCGGSYAGEGAAVNFECTSFETNPTISLPTVVE